MFVSCDSFLAQEPAVLISARARHLHMQAPRILMATLMSALNLRLELASRLCVKIRFGLFEILLPTTPL